MGVARSRLRNCEGKMTANPADSNRAANVEVSQLLPCNIRLNDGFTIAICHLPVVDQVLLTLHQYPAQPYLHCCNSKTYHRATKYHQVSSKQDADSTCAHPTGELQVS